MNHNSNIRQSEFNNQQSTTVSIPDIASFKVKALTWANHFKTACLLNNNEYAAGKGWDKNWILAVDAIDEVICGLNAFEELKKFQAKAGTDIFGFFSYDLKNQVEKLESKHHDGVQFPELYFFKPRYIIEINDHLLTVNRNYPETYELIELITKTAVASDESPDRNLQLRARTPKEKYIQNIQLIKKQIEEGDYYELNYCNEFFAVGAKIDAVQTFISLNEKAKAPFSCYFKLGEKFLLCASPERFLKKEDKTLTTQPIKGTIRKGNTAEENEQLKKQLQNDIKERAENVMIVDLVRNDLSKSAVAGTVKVKELFGVYEFKTINQMISTVTAQLNDKIHFIDAIKNAFPMGSMTGAPKIKVMQNIEWYEDFKRGLYSGATGYITPDNNFDFNVVIRSILYNAEAGYISAPAGGAITFDSLPENEYEEMLLKGRNMFEVLQTK